MKQERIRVCDLARELHISSRELVQTARELDVNVIRATALLTQGQVHTLRNAIENRRATRRGPTMTAPISSPPPTRPEEALRFAKCTCCEYNFGFLPHKESRELCKECLHHFARSGESGVAVQIRLEDHVKQSRLKVAQYREACEKLSKERDEAYAKRNKWMAALVEIVVAHGPAEDDDGCVCGSPEFPCVTRRHLREVNRGIYERCEELEGMSERDFNKILYGTDYSFFTEWDDAG